MAMSRDEIFELIKTDVLTEALGVDEDEITLNASLTDDLGAESIDFLDIQFRLEKAFSTDDREFKIGQGELLPENLIENEDWVKEGRFTDEGMKMLVERMPHVDFGGFSGDVNKLGPLLTVGSIVEFVDRKLHAGAAAG